MTDSGEGRDVLRRRVNAVEWIVFNRPHVLNAMNTRMEDQIIEACEAINRDPGVRAVVLAGVRSNRPAFIAGADFDCLGAIEDEDDYRELERRGEEVLAAIEGLRVPTIAALAGACAGGGAVIAAIADVRLASSCLNFVFPIARTAGNCLTLKNYARLASMLGANRAKDLMLSTAKMTAGDLLAAGAVRQVAADQDELHGLAQAAADRLSEFAPLTLRATREAFRRLRDHAIPEGADDDLLASCYLSSDFREGVKAFKEKRKPQWEGK